MIGIREFKKKDVPDVKRLTDQEIGNEYFSVSELEDLQKKSLTNGINCSFVLSDGDKIVGVRLCLPPLGWHPRGKNGISYQSWPHPKEKMAYFQSLFISKEFRNQGWGKKLSMIAIQQLIKIGAKGAFCHAWKESPENSSLFYLKSLGFREVQEHPK